MAHRDYHPTPVDGCFGCKVAGVAYDRKHLTRSRTDENRAMITEHRDGRQDVTIRAPCVGVRASTTEER